MGNQAIIMAGGAGKRLRPLTCGRPKPLMPVLGKPVMEYTLSLLRQHGVTDAGVTVGYMAEAISTHFGDGSKYGMNLHFFREDTPLGTAGSVRVAANNLHDTFFVLSGDGLTDCNLSAALAFHRKKKAMATLVLARSDRSLEYGVVVTGQGGKVEKFIEKPSIEEAISDRVNTGIYILEPEVLSLIPTDRPYDFGRELFPMMVEKDLGVFGYQASGYWCDIGDTQAYVQANVDMLSGRIALEDGHDRDKKNNIIAKSARINSGARIIPPCYIGSGAHVATGTQIGPYAVLGERTEAFRQSHIKRSILWEGAQVDEYAELSGCVVGENAHIGAQSKLYEGSILGDGCVMEPESALLTSVKAWPCKHIESGLQAQENIIWGNCVHNKMKGGYIDTLSAQDAVRRACLWAQETKAKRMCIMHTGSDQAQAIARHISSALCIRGVHVYDLGAGSEPILQFSGKQLAAQASLFVKKRAVCFFDDKQNRPSKEQKKTLEALWPPENTLQGARAAKVERIHGALSYYLAHLYASVDHKAIQDMQLHAVVLCESVKSIARVNRLIELLGLINIRVERLNEAHLQVRSYEMGFCVSKDEKSLVLCDAQGKIGALKQAMLRAIALVKLGEQTILLSQEDTFTLEQTIERMGASTLRANASSEKYEEALSAYPLQKEMFHDALFALTTYLSLLSTEQTTIRGLLESAPNNYIHEEKIACPRRDVAKLLSALARIESFEMNYGVVRSSGKDRHITLFADGQSPRLRIRAESSDMESASEFCSDVVTKAKACMADLLKEKKALDI